MILKPTPDSSFYVTYDRTNGFQGDSNFGGLIFYARSNDGAGHNHSVNSGILDNLSQLYEAGYKASLFKQALFFNIDGFYQTRIEAPTNTTGSERRCTRVVSRLILITSRPNNSALSVTSLISYPN